MQFRVLPEHPSLPGHFPGRPVVPGVVVLDRVCAAIETVQGLTPHALHLPQVKFLQPLLPGETAKVELQGTAPRWRFRVLRVSDGVPVVTGEVAVASTAGATPVRA